MPFFLKSREGWGNIQRWFMLGVSGITTVLLLPRYVAAFIPGLGTLGLPIIGGAAPMALAKIKLPLEQIVYNIMLVTRVVGAFLVFISIIFIVWCLIRLRLYFVRRRVKKLSQNFFALHFLLLLSKQVSYAAQEVADSILQQLESSFFQKRLGERIAQQALEAVTKIKKGSIPRDAMLSMLNVLTALVNNLC